MARTFEIQKSNGTVDCSFVTTCQEIATSMVWTVVAAGPWFDFQQDTTKSSKAN